VASSNEAIFLGGKFDWSKITEEQMRSLSEEMFDASRVPEDVRQEYWKEFEKMKAVMRRLPRDQ
jgi:HNH/Endo VII superfamily toxin with a SHH signature